MASEKAAEAAKIEAAAAAAAAVVVPPEEDQRHEENENVEDADAPSYVSPASAELSNPEDEDDACSLSSSSSSVGADEQHTQVSSSSSPSSPEPADRHRQQQQQQQQQQRQHELKETIQLSRQSSSDSDMAFFAPPVHQFGSHSSSIYDSDASDGSIVFNYPGTPPFPPHDKQQQQQHHHSRSSRDRFPSFDSLASTGSFRIIGNSATSPYHVSPQPQPQATPPVQMLPYAQRRKLLQQREQQQSQHQQQQPQSQQRSLQQMPMYSPFMHQPPPPAPPNPYGQHAPSLRQQQQQQQQPMHQSYPMPADPNNPYGIPPYAVPPTMGRTMQMPNAMGAPPPPPPIGFLPQQQQPSSSQQTAATTTTTRPPTSSGRSRMSPPPTPPQHQRTSSAAAAAAATKSRTKAVPPPPAAAITTAKQQQLLHHYLPPSGQVRGRTSSTDSMDGGGGPPRPQRQGDASGGSTGLPPPPPPPPPPLTVNPYHIRADSSGSISSIGSSGSRGEGGGGTLTDRLGNDIAGYLQQDTPFDVDHGARANMQAPPPPPPPPLGTDANAGFYGFLSVSPTSSSQQQSQMSVEEFHRRNQEFLQQQSDYHRNAQLAMQQHLNSPLQRQHRHHQQLPPTSPRATRSHRPGLSSIDNDNWEEDLPDGPQPGSHRGRTVRHGRGRPGGEQRQQSQQHSFDPYHLHYGLNDAALMAARGRSDRQSRRDRSLRAGDSSSEVSSSFDDSEEDASSNAVGEGEEATERTSLLPPSGISSYEHGDGRNSYANESQRSSRDRAIRKSRNSRKASRRGTERWDNTAKGRSRRKRRNRHRHSPEVDDDLYRSSSSSSYQDSSRRQRQMQIMENERKRLIAQWKAEALAEAEAERKEYEANRWDRRFGDYMKTTCTTLRSKWLEKWIKVETFISNLPLTLGAVALSIVTLGVVWFKFAEENLDSCQPVHFHSSQCTFPEFPGCFYCDTTARMYKVAVNFHFTCSAIAGILAVVFFAKVFLATRVVLDEMSSPTTASPAGLICMTIVCVFAGRGLVGQVLVSAAAALHLCLAVWFIYMALAFHIMPEPSWFPNTVGIGLSAVKTWLYYPMPGHLLMAVSLSLNFFFFPISLVRVPLNEKMSAPATWIQMSAPAVSLYALTIMAQPSFIEEHPDVTHFQKVHRMVYLPFMHILFALAVVGMISSIQAFLVRWPSFKTKPFSPAHAAFCFPTLAHANAVQAYRAAVNAFSDIPVRSPFKIALYSYWVTVLVGGTIATIYITTRFIYHLPGWTQIDVADEEEPPPPSETALTLQHAVTTGETLQQPFVSPAVLQANETGALVMLPSRGADGRRRYRRTRRLTALGFEPIMNIIEMDHELEVILEYVAKHPPRRRTQTLSVPGIDFNYGFGDFGAGNTGVYDDRRHSRSHTMNFPSTRSGASTLGENPHSQSSTSSRGYY